MTAPSNKLVIKWFSSTISSAYHGIAWKPKSKSIKQCKNTAICRNLPNLIQLNCVFPPKILTTNAWQPRFVADVHVSEGLQNWVPSMPGSPRFSWSPWPGWWVTGAQPWPQQIPPRSCPPLSWYHLAALGWWKGSNRGKVLVLLVL